MDLSNSSQVHLPDDVLFVILGYLDWKSLIRCEAVSKRFRQLLMKQFISDKLWRHQFVVAYGEAQVKALEKSIPTSGESKWKRLFAERSLEMAFGIHSSEFPRIVYSFSGTDTVLTVKRRVQRDHRVPVVVQKMVITHPGVSYELTPNDAHLLNFRGDLSHPDGVISCSVLPNAVPMSMWETLVAADEEKETQELLKAEEHVTSEPRRWRCNIV